MGDLHHRAYSCSPPDLFPSFLRADHAALIVQATMRAMTGAGLFGSINPGTVACKFLNSPLSSRIIRAIVCAFSFDSELCFTDGADTVADEHRLLQKSAHFIPDWP